MVALEELLIEDLLFLARYAETNLLVVLQSEDV
jgi:hypothetical protein